MPYLLDGLMRLNPNAKTKRISSYDTSGGNGDCKWIATGATLEMANIKGGGVIRHIWVTISCDDTMHRRNIILRMFWNGEEKPSVECPIGDFFGQGWGEHYNYISLPLCAAPQDGKALNAYFPMPFLNGARIEVENQCDVPVGAFYYYVDYEENNSLPENTVMFHAQWRRELTMPEGSSGSGENEWEAIAKVKELNPDVRNNYVFADIAGSGHFVGVNYFVDCPTPMWYGEGDDMWLIDGEPWPGSMHGTGTEDFFNSSWCPSQIYQHPYFGYARLPDPQFGWIGRTHCYHFFLADPIHFTKSLHASIEHGHANVLTLDLTTVAYWYQTEPHKAFPALPPRSGRENMPIIGAREIHRWRDSWRREIIPLTGTKNPWGNEQKPDVSKG